MFFRNTGIGTRVNLIVVAINLTMLIALLLLANSASDNALESQAIDRFVTKNNQVVSTLDARFQRILSNARRLSSALAQVDVTNTGALRASLTDYILTDDDAQLIYRIGLSRPDGSFGILQIPNPASPQNYSWRIYRANETVPRDSDFFDPLRTGQPNWFRQARAIYDNEQRPSISLSLPYRQAGDIAGIVWIDLPLTTVRSLVLDALNERGVVSETASGYAFLLDTDRVPLTTANLTFAGSASQLSRNLQILLGRLASSEPNSEGLYETIDTLSRKPSFVSSNTINATGWQFISTLPFDEIPSLPLSILAPLLVLAFFGIIMLTFTIDRFVRFALVVPLKRLGTAAQEIGAGDLRYYIDYRNQADEIGRLAKAMEDMKRSLAHSYDELSTWSRTLEQRVSERTRELNVAQQAAERAANQLRAVYAESLQVVTESQLQRVLEAFIQRILNLLKANYVAVWLLDEERETLRLLATNEKRHEQDTVLPVTMGIAGQAIQQGRPILVDDYPSYEHRARVTNFTDSTPFIRGMCVPLMFVGRPIGAVVVGRDAHGDAFDDNEERQLTLFANLVSPSVRNAQLYVQAQKAEEDAARANSVKTRFLASVTHELRTPLNLIINNMDFMRIGAFGEVNPEQLSRLNQTTRSAEHLLYLINDLLDISKIEAGEMQLFIKPNDVYIMLEDSLDDAHALMEKLEDKSDKVQLEVDIEPNLPKLPMDVRRIRQVITNLLSNAIKFTQAGEVRLTVRGTPEGVLFEVKDTGMGIAPEELSALFEAFERTNLAKEQQIEGTGLGLPISQFLIREHGGEIHVESEVGKGSRFWFSLPYEQEEHSEQIKTSDIRAMLSSSSQ